MEQEHLDILIKSSSRSCGTIYYANLLHVLYIYIYSYIYIHTHTHISYIGFCFLYLLKHFYKFLKNEGRNTIELTQNVIALKPEIARTTPTS